MKLLKLLGGLVVSSMVIGGIGLFAGLDFTSQLAASDTKAATGAAMQAISFNQEIMETVGSPMTFGEPAIQRSERGFVGPSTVTLSLAVEGPKAKGKATVTVVRPGPRQKWRASSGSFFPPAGRPIFLRGQN